ncbi:VOC family protein [Kribbella sp. NPDC054772]
MTHLLRDSDAMIIYIGCPEGRDRALAEFYRDLLGMQLHEPWGDLALQKRPPDADYIAGKTTDGGSKLRLGIGRDGWSDDRPPRWPDPEYPQHLHFDIAVPDAAAAEELVLSRGATLLRDQGQFRTYADPVGHPFCLYADPSAKSAELQRVVFDCYSPRALASFYEGFLGVPKRLEDSPTWVVLDLDDDDDLPNLAFQYAQVCPTRFPDPAYPAQVHIDYRFPDGAQPAIDRAEGLGAIHMPPNRSTSQCYADPAGHPFCI